MADCAKLIDTAGPIAFGCDLDVGHDGPHRAAENAYSVRERAEWESRNQPVPESEKTKLSDLQAPAQTTAERYTMNPTPVPGSATAQPDPDQPILTKDAVGDCQPCQDGEHQVCLQKADILAVKISASKEAVTNFCGCFQASPTGHGLNLKQKESAGATLKARDEDSSPEPEEQAVSKPEPVAEEESVTYDALDDDSAADPQPEPEPEPEVVPEPEPEPEPEAEVEAEVVEAEVVEEPESEESVQDRLVQKMATAVESGNMTPEEFEAMSLVIESSKKKRGTTGELVSFNDKDTLQLANNKARDLLVYLSSMQDARDASYEKLVSEVEAAINAMKVDDKATSLSVKKVAEVAVKTIFSASGGPIK